MPYWTSVSFAKSVKEEKFSLCLWWHLVGFTGLYSILMSREDFHSNSWQEGQRIIFDYHQQQLILLALRGKEVMETD